MIRDVLRSIGIGCLIAAGILHFAPAGKADPASEASYKDQVSRLTEELQNVKRELAAAQTISSADKSEAKIETESDQSKGAGKEPIVKTILSIRQGEVSTTISSQLERAGVIPKASEFDKYLSDNGLAGRLQVGEYEVDSSMDLKTIASLITKTK